MKRLIDLAVTFAVLALIAVLGSSRWWELQERIELENEFD